MTLQEQILEAQEAQAEILELEQKRRQAGALPKLRQQQKENEERQQALKQLEDTKADIANKLGQIAPMVQSWRGRLATLQHEIQSVQTEQERLNTAISDAGNRLQQAVEIYNAVGWTPQEPNSMAEPHGKDFSREWSSVGGDDPNLRVSIAGKDDKLSLMFDLLQSGRKYYDNVRYFYRKFKF